MNVARRMWGLFEPIHAVTYFAPQSRAAYEAFGLRGFWRGYFAGRAAPLGPVGPAPVFAAFFSFARPMVDRALPAVWSLATPQAALEGRRAGAHQALTAITPDIDHAEAATLLRAAAERADTAGRVLGSANAALTWPDHPLDVVWHAATILREHRGDGHVAALVIAGFNGCEALAMKTAFSGHGRELMQAARGWTDDDWAAAVDSLTSRGWLDGDGAPTDAGRKAHDEVETNTDRLAAGPWHELGDANTDRLAELLRPLATASAALLHWPNPIGLPDPRSV